MRMHIELDDALVRRIDEAAGPRRRTEFVRRAVEAALAAEERWKLVEAARGALSGRAHDWDDDAARWVRHQRRSSTRRVG